MMHCSSSFRCYSESKLPKDAYIRPNIMKIGREEYKNPGFSLNMFPKTISALLRATYSILPRCFC